MRQLSKKVVKLEDITESYAENMKITMEKYSYWVQMVLKCDPNS